MLAVLLGALEARAARNVTSFEVRYTPTANLVPVELPGEWRSQLFELDVRDGRATDRELVGTRTDDDDRPYELRALNDTRQVVAGALSDMLTGWGFSLGPPSGASTTASNTGGISLTVDLAMLRVTETNQAVGATYEAQVQLLGTMAVPGASAGLQGVGSGDATRYGKKFSNANCNEVLSDALTDAMKALFNDLVQQSARPPEKAEASETGAASDAGRGITTPEHLLAGVLELRSAAVAEDLIVDFIDNWTLTRPLSAQEVLEFRDVLGSDLLLQAILRRPIAGR